MVREEFYVLVVVLSTEFVGDSFTELDTHTNIHKNAL